MTFVWPQALLALALIPLGFLVLRAVDRRRGRKVAAFAGGEPFGAQGGSTPGGRPATARPSLATRAKRTIPGALILRGHRRDDPRPGSAAGHDRRPAPGRHGHPRLRHLGQHGRPPTSSRPGWPPRSRPRPTSSMPQPASVVIGVVAFSDSGIAVQQPTQRPGCGHRRARPAASAARDVARPRHRCVAGRHRREPPRVRPSTTTPTARPSRRPRRRPSRRGPMPRPSSSC